MMTRSPENTKQPQARILVADDEDNTRLALVRALQLKGFISDGARDGKETLQMLEATAYDLLLLDLHMPEVDGIGVMESIRQDHPYLAVIILTAYASLDSAIAAVKAGADDYLIKPQHFNEIETAIQKALNKRAPQQHRHQAIQVIEQALSLLQTREETLSSSAQPIQNARPTTTFSFDPECRTITIRHPGQEQERVAELTGDQAAILSYLVAHPEKVLTNREIAQAALNYSNLSEKEAEGIIRAHILRIRRKIETDPDHPRLIRNIRGRGYIFFPP